MTNYDQFADYYDKVMWEPKELAAWIKKLSKGYNPGAKSIFELACGTGSLLALFKNDFEVTGLDLSQGMLDKAKAKIPEGTFILGDMTDFSLDKKFDIVACIFDSINHLNGLEKWGMVFEKASEHLGDKGFFIFDFNTLHKLELISKKDADTTEFDDKSMVMKINKQGEGYDFDVKVVKDGREIMREEITEYAYPTEDIIDEAKKYFNQVDLYDHDLKSKPNDESFRIHVICRN